MQTVIVPVDFSENSLKSASYAVKLLTGHYGVTMILHHVYEDSTQSSEVAEKLEKLKAELMTLGIVKITTLAEEGTNFITALDKLARHQQADLVIMGITGRSVIGQVFIGSNTLKMIQQKVCPVLIVPADANYKDIKNVLLTSDFKNVQLTTPSLPIKKVLKTFHPELHIMNVNSEYYVSITEEYEAEKNKLAEIFSDFRPEFYFLGLQDVDEAIDQFAHDKNVDLIVIVHKGQSLFSKLFVKSHTKKLIYHSNIPVLAIHE